MVQLWTNLPKADKMSAPGYQAIPNETMGRYILSGNSGFVEVIAGKYNDVEGPAHTHSPISLMNARLNLGGKATFSFPESYNTALLVVQGSILANEIDVPENNFVKFENKGEVFTVEATEPDTVVLIMSGKPLHEPIVAYGPFVMNTKQEIMQAFDDLNHGKFGYLED